MRDKGLDLSRVVSSRHRFKPKPIFKWKVKVGMAGSNVGSSKGAKSSPSFGVPVGSLGAPSPFLAILLIVSMKLLVFFRLCR